MPPGKAPSLRLAALLVIASLLIVNCGREEELSKRQSEKRFNIVLIVSDALRQDVLGCYGGEALTPNIDRIAADGVLFENAYSTSPWTGPSAVSIFTGSYATSYPCSALSWTRQILVPDAETLLAEALTERGYETALKNENVQASLHNCFQGFAGLDRDGLAAELTDSTMREIEEITGEPVSSNRFYRQSYHVLARLLSLSEGTNFFFAHWMLDPHEPYRPVEKFASRIVVDKSALKLPPARYTARSKIKRELNDEEARYLEARYRAEVESVDERIGFVYKILEHRNLLESTYIVLTADHGELFGEHQLYSHGGYFFEDILRVPLIICGPGLPADKRVDTPVSLVDLTATLVDLLGIEYDGNMQGESFRELARGRRVGPKPLYFDDVKEHKSIDALIDDDFKLIVMRDGTNRLYNLSRDPGETNDVAYLYPERVSKMLSSLQQFREANQKRLTANLILLGGGGTTQLNDEEREELQKKLKSLGYIQ
jgi:arylsulfatase A-like enzyme